MSRPSETITAAVGSVIGAVFALLAALGINIPEGVNGPVIILVSWLAAGTTYLVARKQRAGDLPSGADGRVK